MNNNIIKNTFVKKILIIGIFIFFINCINKQANSKQPVEISGDSSFDPSINPYGKQYVDRYVDSKVEPSIEPFIDIKQANMNHLNKRCNVTYGKYHPKCMQLDKLNHVGYFKLNTSKYPLIDLNNGDYTFRYVMFKDKFIKLNKKYWNKGYYFQKPFYYDKNIPFYIVMNFLYRGVVVNTYNNKIFYIFGKKLDDGTYKYILFRKKNNHLYLSFNLPPRNKLLNGDTMYIRDKTSTFGPFIYYKK